ncbi:MAG: L-serine dehydratase [Oleispira sp.]|jgi:L-serine dehydratase
MFISALDLFKLGIGPSSSHTVGPMIAANNFLQCLKALNLNYTQHHHIVCTLKGSLALTGKGHSTDNAILLGLHGHLPEQIAQINIKEEIDRLWSISEIKFSSNEQLTFNPNHHIIFDKNDTLAEHPNGLIFQLLEQDTVLLEETYFSIGGGFVNTLAEMKNFVAPLKMVDASPYRFPFDGAQSMLEMANTSQLSIAQMKRQNEHRHLSDQALNQGLDAIWHAMKICVENGLKHSGILPGGLNVLRRAKNLHQQLIDNPNDAHLHEWLCAYAMAVNEENAAGHAVVTAPTNGAAGVIPAILYYCFQFEELTSKQVHDFLLTAAAIGGIIKHKSSISGAEVGCQGEVGSASAMAAAGLCAIKGGTPEQIENAAEIALEHHLGMTCDPVKGLVQIPCIERNGFGALKAYTAASLALRGSGQHIMSLDNCISAMKQTGLEMSVKFKETSLGGLAVNYTEC